MLFRKVIIAALLALSATGNNDAVVVQDDVADPSVHDDITDSSINVAGILDTDNFYWAELIFNVTIDLLNDKNNGFFDEEMASIGSISYQVKNAACNGFDALSAYWEVRPVHGIIGARCTDASIPLAWLGALENTPQISMSTTAAKLSDKTQFPLFSRLVAPGDERGLAGAMVQTLSLLGWDRVTMINTDTDYAKGMATSFQRIWQGDIAYQATVELLPNGTINEASLMNALQNAPLDDPVRNSKVYILMGHDQHVFPILDIAQNYLPPDSIYFGPPAWVGRPATNQYPEIPGYLGVVPFRNRDSAYQQFLKLGGSRLNPILNEEGDLPDYAAEHTVDAIIAMVLALAATPVNLRHDGEEVTKQLRKLEFDGVSGRVGFTKEGDRRDPRFSIYNFQRTNDGDRWVMVGTAGIEVGTAAFGPGGIQEFCFAGVGCNNTKAPADRYPVPPPPEPQPPVWAMAVIPAVCVVFFLTFFSYRRKKIIAGRKRKELLEAMVDMCTAEMQYVPNLGNSVRSLNGPTGVPTPIPPPIPPAWCWKESDGYMSKWDDSMIMGDPSKRWIKYENGSNQLLEVAFQKQGRAGHCRLGDYTVDFGNMEQTKDVNGFKRKVKRVFEEEEEEEEEKNAPRPEQPLDSSIIHIGDGIPQVIANEPQMVLVSGDIVQISKKRDDGWAYGTKLHLEDEPLVRRLVQLCLADRDDTDDEDGKDVLPDTGWFPTDATRQPNTDDLATLRQTLGGASNLRPPVVWDKVENPRVAQKSESLPPASPEYRKVVDSFMTTLPATTRIISVERIQNVAMWQSYIVKRKTVIEHDQSFGGAASQDQALASQALARFERRWLWHGTNAEVVEKIIQQGFNRSFCGKNATMYGKGVYFAEKASYSSRKEYAAPDHLNRQYILACRVVVGEYCLGKRDARTPDLRDAERNILFDSTVDDLKNPKIYVTYHDAQAYPEYLIVFQKMEQATS